MGWRYLIRIRLMQCCGRRWRGRELRLCMLQRYLIITSRMRGRNAFLGKELTWLHWCSVVLLDELDQLVLAKQTVLYNLFNWPTLPNSRLIVIAVANTMNLADMLPNKIQSRVGKSGIWQHLTTGLTRVNFEPYTMAQLVQIIESRLENVPQNIIEKDAIRLCAMRIANNTGDARKALDICR